MSDRQKHGLLEKWGAKAAAVTAILGLIFLIFPRLQPSRETGPQPAAPSPQVAPAGVSRQPGDIILGTWRHYHDLDENGNWTYISTVVVARSATGYIMSVREQAESNDSVQIVNGLALFDVESDGTTWTFNSNWGGGRVGHFVLKHVSPILFEGHHYEGRVRGEGRHKFVKVG